MGLFREIALLPLAPLRVAAWSVGVVADAALAERRARIGQELAGWENALLAGEITEEEFDRREDELLDELEDLGGGPIDNTT
ncbi:gas vesicle protein GvpG [Amycolatopsis sp. NPDC059027]|uniref:gas vesicle protein GvpG n=1 Tax=Amycolatopsis sp. NPDC059027 TaxID=3346709 RepID=UPI00366D57FF